jgi:hypothetical protein
VQKKCSLNPPEKNLICHIGRLHTILADNFDLQLSLSILKSGLITHVSAFEAYQEQFRALVRKATFGFLPKVLRNKCGFSEKNEENFLQKGSLHILI